MSTKADYSEEEWTQLMMAPVNGGMYIIMADLHVTSMPGEMQGMFKSMIEQPVPEGAQELVGSLVEDFKAKAENKEKMETPDSSKQDPEQFKKKVMESLSSTAALLTEKSSEEEAAGYKQWLMGVAQATAEAGKEGGFLGIGGVRVSDKEKAALGEISTAIGL